MQRLDNRKLQSGGLREGLKQKDRARRERTKALAKSSVTVRTRNDLLPELKLVKRDPHWLKLPAHNVRTKTPAQVRAVINSVRALGFTDPVLIHNDEIIDGVVRAEASERDHAGRPLPAWTGCREVAEGEVLLLNASEPASLDGRYFGPLPTSSIEGCASPIWTESRQ